MPAETATAIVTSAPETNKQAVTESQSLVTISKKESITELHHLYNAIAKQEKLDDSCNVLIGFETDLGAGLLRKIYQLFGGARRTAGKDNSFSALRSDIENIIYAYGQEDERFGNEISNVDHFACYVIGATYSSIENTYQNSERDQLAQINALLQICRKFDAHQFVSKKFGFSINFSADCKRCLQDVINTLAAKQLILERNNKYNTLQNNMFTLGQQIENLLGAYRHILLHMTFEKDIPSDLLAGSQQKAAFVNSELTFDVLKQKNLKKSIKNFLQKEEYDFIKRACFAPAVAAAAEKTQNIHNEKINLLRNQIAAVDKAESSQDIVDAEGNKMVETCINKTAVREYFQSAEFMQQVQAYKKVLALNNQIIDVTLECAMPIPFQEIDKKLQAMEMDYKESGKPGLSAAQEGLRNLKTFLKVLGNAYKLIPRLMNLKEQIDKANFLIKQFGNFAKPMLLEQFQEVLKSTTQITGEIRGFFTQLTTLSDSLKSSEKELEKNGWNKNVKIAVNNMSGLRNTFANITQCVNVLNETLSNEAIADDMFESLKAVSELVTRQSFDGVFTQLSDLAICIPLTVGFKAQQGALKNEKIAKRIEQLNKRQFSGNKSPLMIGHNKTLQLTDKSIPGSITAESTPNTFEDSLIAKEMKQYERHQDFSFKVFQPKWWWAPLWLTGIGLVVHLGLMLGAGIYRLVNREQINKDLKRYQKLQDQINKKPVAAIEPEPSTTQINSSLQTSVSSKQVKDTEGVCLNLESFLDSDDEEQKPQSIQTQSTVQLIEDLSSQEGKDKKVQTNVGQDIVIKMKEAPPLEENEKLIVSQLINGLSEIAIEKTLPPQLDFAFKEKMQGVWEECKEITKPHEKQQNYFFCQALLGLKNKISSSSANLPTIEQAILSSLESLLMTDLENNIKLAAVSAAATGRHIGGAMLDEAIKPLVRSYPPSVEINAIIVKVLTRFLELIGSNRIVSTSNRLFDTQPDPTFKALADRKKIADTRAELGRLILAYAPEKTLENNNTPSRRRTSSAT